MTITIAIVAITCVVSYLAFNNRVLMDRLMLWPPAIARRGEYHRLLSYGLIHADLQHLLFNMVTLFFFGRAIEGLFADYIGPLGFVLFYLGGLLVSILPSYLANRGNPEYRSLGASGAVSAVLFAFIVLQPWAMIYVFVLPVPAIVFAVGYVAWTWWSNRRGGGDVNHSAHLWGAAYGVAFLLIMEPRALGVFVQRLLSPGFG